MLFANLHKLTLFNKTWFSFSYWTTPIEISKWSLGSKTTYEFTNSNSYLSKTPQTQSSHATFYFHAQSNKTNNWNQTNHYISHKLTFDSFYHDNKQLQQPQQELQQSQKITYQLKDGGKQGFKWKINKKSNSRNKSSNQPCVPSFLSFFFFLPNQETHTNLIHIHMIQRQYRLRQNFATVEINKRWVKSLKVWAVNAH